MTLAPLNRLAQLASQRSDVVIAAFMLLAVVMMIMPLPTGLVDVLIAFNMAFSLLILVVAFYVARSVDFSALPPIILLSTLFRLSLSITTTRLILLDGDAGEIVAAFGEFVIAGEVVIGLVVFLIITVAQFLVITKGAERVAEVAARFTLDAMPGKQMSIDNDLRNGDIEPQEARFRRGRLERESQLYGAMDGAMKFVKGDAIASLVILFVNLFGGLAIGMVKRDMAFGDAVHTYSLLTVGDGLIAQIPALLIAVAAGIVVTRVASEDDRDLGTEIVTQLGANQRALALTSLILLGMAFIPGFPAPVFLVIAAILGGAAFAMHRRTQASSVAAETINAQALQPVSSTPEVDSDEQDDRPLRVVLWVSETLRQACTLAQLRERAEDVRQDLILELGIQFPAVGVRVDKQAAAERFSIDLEGVRVSGSALPLGHVLALDEAVHLQLLGVDFQPGTALQRKRDTLWVKAEQCEALEQAGIGYLHMDQAIAEYLRLTLRRYAGDFLGIQETRALLTQMEGEYPELVKEALRTTPIQRVAEIFRRLLDEGIAVRNLRALLEALVEWGPRDLELHVISEHARSALARHICHQHADAHRVICAYVLDRPLEDAMRQALRRTEPGRAAGLPEDLTRAVVERVRREFDGMSGDLDAVVMASADLRRYLRQMLVRHDLDVPVLSYQDLTREYTLQSLAAIGLPEGAPGRLQGSAERALAQ